MADNLRHWSALCATDPAQTKSFNRGFFKGTAIKPIWTEMRMTEHFGPCGVGWGMNAPDFRLVPAGEELLVFCTVHVWYVDPEVTTDNVAIVWGVGGDKVIQQFGNGKRNNDEAFKSAYTDALGNAMKHIGVAADVHMGLFDDNKYVREQKEAFAKRSETPAEPVGDDLEERMWASARGGVHALAAFVDVMTNEEKRAIGKDVYDRMVAHARQVDLEKP